MTGSARRYGCPSIDSILAAKAKSGVYIILTDLVSQEPTFVLVLDAIESIIEPHRLSRFSARSFDGRTGFEGTVELREGRFIAEVTLAPLLPQILTA